MKSKDPFPILGIDEYHDQLQTDHHFLFHELLDKRIIEKPHKHDFFMLLLVQKGSGMHSIDFVDYKVSDHQIHVLFPDQVHRWDLKKSTIAFQLMIDSSNFELFTDSLAFSFILFQSHPVIQLGEGAFQGLLTEFKAIEQELRLKPIHWNIIHLRTRLVSELISREVEQHVKDIAIFRTKPQLYAYHSLVNEHFKQEKTVAFYANQLHITANYLNILCRKYFKVSALYIIQKRISLEAKRLLNVPERSIKEIAYDLGFNDPAYFSNFFKEQTGLSPKSFRERI